MIAFRFYITLQFFIQGFRCRVNPFKFFQLNADFFNKKKGFFSKTDLEKLIPLQWRLKSFKLDPQKLATQWQTEIIQQFSFPVFCKPEWGQSSHGVYRADNTEELTQILQNIKKQSKSYFVQEAAKGTEVDIFYITKPHTTKETALHIITQTHNPDGNPYPINGVFGQNHYQEITSNFTTPETKKILNYFQSIASFKITRIGVKTKNTATLLKGDFKIIEINLFTPLALNILDKNLPIKQRKKIIKTYMQTAFANTKAIDPQKKPISIFWPMCKHLLK